MLNRRTLLQGLVSVGAAGAVGVSHGGSITSCSGKGDWQLDMHAMRSLSLQDGRDKWDVLLKATTSVVDSGDKMTVIQWKLRDSIDSLLAVHLSNGLWTPFTHAGSLYGLALSSRLRFQRRRRKGPCEGRVSYVASGPLSDSGQWTKFYRIDGRFTIAPLGVRQCEFEEKNRILTRIGFERHKTLTKQITYSPRGVIRIL